jgi:BioD-like phosphotransacetylase family protein
VDQRTETRNQTACNRDNCQKVNSSWEPTIHKPKAQNPNKFRLSKPSQSIIENRYEKRVVISSEDKYLFVESTFVDRKHELEALQKMLHNIVANNADKPDVQVNAIARLHEISVSLGGLYDILPIIGGVNPRSLVIEEEEEVEKGKIPEDYDPRTDLNRLF